MSSSCNEMGLLPLVCRSPICEWRLVVVKCPACPAYQFLIMLRGFVLRMRGCGTVTWAEAPDGVTAPVQYGPRAAAIGVYLWHGQFMSRDRACQAMADLFGCAPSPGALASMARRIAGAAAPAIDAVRGTLAAAPVAHFDETRFRVAGKLAWVRRRHAERRPPYRPAEEEARSRLPDCRPRGGLPPIRP